MDQEASASSHSWQEPRPQSDRDVDDCSNMDEDATNPPTADEDANVSAPMGKDASDCSHVNDASDYHRLESEDSYEPRYTPYWELDHAGHFWNDECGWLELNPGRPPEPWWIEEPPARTPSDPDYLCDLCRHINFLWLFEDQVSDQAMSKKQKIRIGTVERVLKQAECSFCSLLAPTCIQWVANTPSYVTEHDVIFIQSKSFSNAPEHDYNWPRVGVNQLSIGQVTASLDLQVIGEAPMRGREISPRITRPTIARSWLEMCEHEHTSGRDEPLVPNLALIDLENQCIMRPNKRVRYAALSYVWGKVKHTSYNKDTRELLETPRGLVSNAVVLPQTIRDAIDLAVYIGLSYLWVDSLCIFQDDEASKSEFISQMGSIYDGAALTIVDACGTDADCELAGISIPREDFQRVATVQGMRLATVIDERDRPLEINFDCTWLERGWTYQEMLLSKRLLLVTARQLQFVCNHAVYIEEYHPYEPRTTDWILPTESWIPIRRSATVGTPMSHLYFTSVKLFTERALTFETDIVPAFEAIFNTLYRDTGAKSLFNLPDIELEEALLWRGRGLGLGETLTNITRRRCPDQFSSWSWAGWKKRSWYRVPGAPPPRSAISWLYAPVSSAKDRSGLTPQDYRCRDWREKGWSHKYLRSWQAHTYTHDSMPGFLFRHPIELDSRAGSRNMSFVDDLNILNFLAFTVSVSTSADAPGLRLMDEDRSHKGGLEKDILDSSQYLAGHIVLDCLPTGDVDLRLIAMARCSPEHIDLDVSEQRLAIDLNTKAPLDWDPAYFDNISSPNDNVERKVRYSYPASWDDNRFQDKFYPLYTTLLVEVREGIAYRIGIGEVHIDAFHAADPVKEEVRLG